MLYRTVQDRPAQSWERRAAGGASFAAQQPSPAACACKRVVQSHKAFAFFPAAPCCPRQLYAGSAPRSMVVTPTQAAANQSPPTAASIAASLDWAANAKAAAKVRAKPKAQRAALRGLSQAAGPRSQASLSSAAAGHGASGIQHLLEAHLVGQRGARCAAPRCAALLPRANGPSLHANGPSARTRRRPRALPPSCAMQPRPCTSAWPLRSPWSCGAPRQRRPRSSARTTHWRGR